MSSVFTHPTDDPERKRRELAYHETLRVLGRQATVLSELRNRANILLTGNAVVASLFGSSLIANGHVRPLSLAILALVALVLGIACCIAVLWSVHDAGELVDAHLWPDLPRWPRSDRPRRWRVSFKLDYVIDFLQSTDTATFDRTCDYFTLARESNYRTIDQRTTYFEVACVLLLLQVSLWSTLLLVH
jgi:hypothetical protein